MAKRLQKQSEVVAYLPKWVKSQKYLKKMDALLPEVDIPLREYGNLRQDDYIALYRYLYMARETEARLTRLYRQGHIVGGVYLSKGMEAIGVGSAYALDKSQGDIIFPLHRNLSAHLTYGQSPYRLYCQYMGRKDSPTGGREGNVHLSDKALRIVGPISHIGAMLCTAVGAAIGMKMQGKNACMLNFIGDGGASIGEFHEGLNFAAVANAPVILIVENNQYAYSTPTMAQYGGARIIDRAPGYGIPGFCIDGNNVFEVYETVADAVKRGRNDEGPTMIEAITMRMRGHSEHDDHFYVPQELLDAWALRDPVVRAARYLEKMDILNEKNRIELENDIVDAIERDIERALASPMPDPNDLEDYLFAGEEYPLSFPEQG